MDNAYVHTPIGIIDTKEAPEGIVCKEQLGVSLGREVTIKSCFTRVVCKKKDGEELVVEPVVMESCMRPGEKVVIPITYNAVYDNENRGNKIVISNKYMEVHIGEEIDIDDCRTEKYEPKIKQKSCAECQNCGRC